MRLLVRSLRRALHQIELLQFSNLNKNQPTFPRQINFQQAYLQHLLTQLFADHLKLLKIASLLDRSAVGPVSLVAFITQTLVNLLIVAQLFYSAELLVLYETAILLLVIGAQLGLAVVCFTTLITVSRAFLSPKEALFKAQTLLLLQASPQFLEVKLKLLTRLEIVSHREAFAFLIGTVGVFTRAFLAKVQNLN